MDNEKIVLEIEIPKKHKDTPGSVLYTIAFFQKAKFIWGKTREKEPCITMVWDDSYRQYNDCYLINIKTMTTKKTKKIPSRNEGKPPICRICSLKDFGGVLIGRDMAEVFTEGHVYEVRQILGEIIIRDLGSHAVPTWLGTKGTISQYATTGVVMLTEAEYQHQLTLEER